MEQKACKTAGDTINDYQCRIVTSMDKIAGIPAPSGLDLSRTKASVVVEDESECVY